MALLHRIVAKIEHAEVLDEISRPLTAAVGRLVQPRLLRNALSGVNLGHPLHPMLTDLPIGAWSMSALLDVMGGPPAERSADLLIGAGILTAIPTAASGLNDWSDTYGPETRVGLVHAGANVTALGLYLASLIARRRGRRRTGRRLAQAGLGVLSAGGYLGGHLSFVRAVGVDHTALEHRPDSWVPVLPDNELADGQHRRVLAGDASVLLARAGGRLYALANTCTHAGGPLDEGQVRDGCVVCPWHSSTFSLDTGRVLRGPASSPQPTYRTRIHDGQIEICSGS